MKKRHFLLASLFGWALLFALALAARSGEAAFAAELEELSLPKILEPLGKNVQTFVETFQETACLEKVEQRVLRSNGKVRSSRVAVYEYLFAVASTKFGISVSEMRREKKRRGSESGTPFMMTNGFPAAVLVFHPEYSADFDYELLGREKRDGRDALVVGFRQNSSRQNRLFWFRTKDKSWPIYVRGKAWIDPASFQVLALETEMIEPNPQAGLVADTTQIEYKEVFFARRKQHFWVPTRIQVKLAWRGRLFQNEHTFSDFRSFDVDTRQTFHLPGVDAPPQE